MLWSYERWRIFMNQRQLSHECCLKKSYFTYIWLIWPFNSKGNHKKTMFPVTDLDFLWFETGCSFFEINERTGNQLTQEQDVPFWLVHSWLIHGRWTPSNFDKTSWLV